MMTELELSQEQQYIINCLKRRPMSDFDLKHSHVEPHLIDNITTALESGGLIERTSDGWRIAK